MPKGWGGKPIGTRWICNHRKVPGMAAGWLVCGQFCGWAGVCRTCLAELGLGLPQEVPWAVCSRHWAWVESKQYRCVDGYVVPVEVVGDGVYEEAGGMPVED